MAITTGDGIIAGAKPGRFYMKALSGTLVAGRPFTYWRSVGIPGAAPAPSSGVNGANLITAQSGQIPFTNPVSGNTHLSRFTADCTQACTVLLVDRIWENSGLSVTLTTSQAITQPTLPARDNNGATLGEGILVGLEIVTATGAGANVPFITYTNSAGTTFRAANPTIPYAASSGAGSFYPFALQAGDTGVRAVNAFQNTVSMSSGSISLVAYRILATVDVGTYAGNAIDAISGGFPQLFDNTVPQIIIIPSATTTSVITGMMTCAQG